MNQKNRKLLIIDDDPGIQRQMRWAFDGTDVLLAGDRQKAVELARRDEPQVALLDLAMPPDLAGPSEGFATLEELMAFNPRMRVIIASGNDEQENAVKAISMGAYDFCSKPVDVEVLQLIVERAFYLYELERENERLSELRKQSPLDGFITGNTAMIKLCKAIERVAPADISVMFTGESGTGKEVLAQALHKLSSRSAAKFVAINCAAIPDNLLESELFGHEKGAFTGAVKRKLGKFELADKGTLLLDEIGEMAAPLQAKLLRFLQERTIERVGGRETIELDIRIISATNKNLQVEIEAGRFRDDLYYRLNEISFHIPPIREREGDPVLLANYLIDKNNKVLGKSIKGLTADGATSISTYTWPGNVRELENRIKRAMVLCNGKLIDSKTLDLQLEDINASFPSL